MAKILFASNNTAHFIGSAGGSVVGTFDSTRVPYSIDLQRGEISGSPMFSESDTDDTWFHFTLFSAGDGSSTYDSETFFEAYDAAGNQLFYIKKRDNNPFMYPDIDLFDGTTTKSGFTNSPMMGGLVNSIDIRYTVSATIIDLEFFINGSSQFRQTFNANGNSYGKPVRFTIGGAFVDENETVMSFSEFIVSNRSTINARMDMLRPAAAGGNAQWLGSLLTLSDDDRTSGMTTLDPNKRQTMTMDPYSGAPNVSNLVAVSTTTRGLNAPTKLSHTVRLGGVDYDGVAHDIPYDAKYIITDFNINPATSLPWTGADIAATEVGFISIA